MRRRNIDPAFWSSDQVIACSMPARLLFIGLWSLADREGRLRDEPGRIKRQLFPDDKTNIGGWLDELTGAGLLERYAVDDEPLIAIPGFKDFQGIHPHETQSKLPPPPRNREMSLHGQPKVVNVTRNSGPSELKPSDTPKPPTGAVRQVFDAWVASTGHKGCQLDEKRTRKIRARLAEFPQEDVIDAVRGWERDPWEGRRAQNELVILLRDAGQVEKFRDLWRQPVVVRPEHQPTGELDRLEAMQRDLTANPDPEVANVIATIAARFKPEPAFG